MESGFTSDSYEYSDSTWQRIFHRGSGRFEFFRVRLFGAMHFVKRPTPRYAHDLQTTESLRKEFNIGYNLSHPGIVRYLRMENGAVFQEYIDGLSMQQMIEQNDERLKSPQFLERMCRQLLEATAYLHSHGVVHNDIKPENVMITRIDNQVKLVDLGCASSDMWDSTSGYTSDFKAPEQGISDPNVVTDIFLVGKLMELLVPIADADRRWKKFIRKATAEGIEKRFMTDMEAFSAIPSKGNSRRSGLIAVISILTVTVVGISLFMLRRESSEILVKEALSDSIQNEDYVPVELKTDEGAKRHAIPKTSLHEAGEKDNGAAVSESPILPTIDQASPSQASLPGINKVDLPAERNLSVTAPGIQPSVNGQINAMIGKTSDASNLKKSSVTENSSLLEQLNADMEKYIKTQYEKRLLPDYRKFAALPWSYDKCRYDVKLIAKWNRVVKDVTGYVERLASEHSELAGEILLKGYSIVEREQLRSVSVKYPKGEETEVKELYNILNHDSIYDIYYKN